MNHTGHCLCGAVELRTTGAPEAMGYCHCTTCRTWASGPVVAFTIWKAEAVTITAGEEHVQTFEKTERSKRKFCRLCGSQLMIAIPTLDRVNVFATTLPTLVFKPSLHVNYAETVLPMRDGLPKLKDFPGEVGGSGDSLPE
ncbi:Uncharacterized conserved protein [Bradyrhizobium shewense]|uniref:Uncharacterized conserved protein n=1 Tax=Bradyrhizobium shewense TaxID=1761772 RepID=A0A1C3USQ5_9BRAD|nr:GFA family protein [Bradyrhizobium shewense]SCB18502.1 Uncharacterized conserved protein [Bradyrhizobium shewense]